MNFKSMKLITLVVVAGLLSLLNLVTWTAPGYSFEGSGLYKDGEKVLGFDLDLPEGITRTISDDTDVGQEVSKKKQFILDARKSAEEFADRFKEQKEFIKIVLECKDLVEEIKRKFDHGEDVESELGLLIQRKNELADANREILRKFDEIEKTCREKGYSNGILDRQTKMVKQHKESTRILMRHLETVAKQRDRDGLLEEIEKLEKYFSENKFKEDPPLINKQALPVNITKVKAPVVQKGVPIPRLEEIIIASTPPIQDDLDPTIDVQFTEDITNLANSLNNSPLKMYEYVKNNFEFEPYLGSRKGSQVTYEHRSGNDYDLASLLIALLRVSNIPARYATGIVEMPVDRAKNWLGVEDGATAGSILTTAGMEGVNVIDGDEVVAIRCRRVWVEAYMPYTNYRGIGNDDTGKMWIPMDPAFKQYDYHPGVDIPAEMDFDTKAFVDDYISAFHEDSPVELYKQQIIDYIAANHPELTYEDVLRTRDLHSETLGLIPGSLPYKLLSWDAEYSEIPADKRYQIRFHIHGEGSTLDYTANLPEIAGKQVTISCIGATPEDQQIIDDSGGLFGVEDPWLVHLKPVLKIDGCEAATGSGEVTMGLSQSSDMHFTPPVGAGNQVPAIYNTIIAGTYQGIGIDTWKVVTDFFAPMSTACEESYTGHLLHDTALKYLGRVDMADEEVNKTMQIVLLNDVAEAIVEHVVKVTFSGGNPITFEWSGLRVDADRKIVGPFSVTGDDEGCNFMRLTGADGSISENRLFEDEFDEEAISAIKILELASDMGIPIYEIDSGNIGAILPLLTVSTSIKNAISDAVAAGHVVTIAQDNITHYDWTGTGYIDMDPDDCAAGYIISGGRSGGETVKEWDIDMSGVYCISATISNVTPFSPTHVYCAENSSYLAFEVYIQPYDNECKPLADYIKTFSTGDTANPMTIKEIADKYGGGVYTFYAGSPGGCSGNCGQDSRDFTIVELNSIKPDIGQEIDDGDSDDDTKIFIVSVSESSDVIVTAELVPDLDEYLLPLGSTINGGTGTGKLQRTVSTEHSSKTVFSFSCGGVTCPNKTTIYVYDAKLGLHSDEGDAADDKYGHSWWSFDVDDDINNFIKSMYPELADDKYFGIAGWWPDTSHPDAQFDPFHGWCIEAPGLVRFGNQSHTATASKTWNIGFDELISALNYVKTLEYAGKKWTVLFDNCTDEAIIVGNKAGISTISYHGITPPKALSDWLNSH